MPDYPNPNNLRARAANIALLAHANNNIDETDIADPNLTEPQVRLSYLLADLRHLCDTHGWDFAALDKSAYSAYCEDRHDGGGIADEVPTDPVPGDTIALTWNIDDVHTVRPDLDDEQCRAVLAKVEQHHDANLGVTWDRLKDAADEIAGVRG